MGKRFFGFLALYYCLNIRNVMLTWLEKFSPHKNTFWLFPRCESRWIKQMTEELQRLLPNIWRVPIVFFSTPYHSIIVLLFNFLIFVWVFRDVFPMLLRSFPAAFDKTFHTSESNKRWRSKLPIYVINCMSMTDTIRYMSVESQIRRRYTDTDTKIQRYTAHRSLAVTQTKFCFSRATKLEIIKYN